MNEILNCNLTAGASKFVAPISTLTAEENRALMAQKSDAGVQPNPLSRRPSPSLFFGASPVV